MPEKCSAPEPENQRVIEGTETPTVEVFRNDGGGISLQVTWGYEDPCTVNFGASVGRQVARWLLEVADEIEEAPQ